MVASKDMAPLPKNFAKVFWHNQFKVKIELPTAAKYSSLEGKVAIITGTNSGLGFESARQLLTLGLSHLIVAVRSIEKGKDAASKLRSANPAAKIEVWPLDMESYDSIQAFVRKCDTELPRIDYTILNAGVSPITFGITKSTGHETAIQVDYISTMLLTLLLLPVLKSKSKAHRTTTQDNNPSTITTTAPRLTIVNSLTAHLCKFPNRHQRPLLPSFSSTTLTPWNAEERYGVSKLLAQLFLVELCSRVPADNAVINMVDPGLTKGTGLARDAKGALLVASRLFFAVAGRPVERGAATYVDAVLGHGGEESHGCFVMNAEIAPLAGFYYSADGKETTKQLWEETMKDLSAFHVEEILDSLK